MDRLNQHFAGEGRMLLRGEIVLLLPSHKDGGLLSKAQVIFKARATNASLSYVQGMAYSGGTEHRGLWPAPIHFGPFPATYRAIFCSVDNYNTHDPVNPMYCIERRSRLGAVRRVGLQILECHVPGIVLAEV